MAHHSGNGSALGVFSQLTRRRLVHNGVLGDAGHADGGADRIALYEGRDHLGPLRVAQLVHTLLYGRYA